MPDIYLHNRKIDSVFELLGRNENDITFSLGWVLSKSKPFLKDILKKIFLSNGILETDVILLQEGKKGLGFTDIEIRLKNNYHVIIEAKRGWSLPGIKQMKRYARRFNSSGHNNVLVVISECSKEYALKHLSKNIGVIPVRYFSWKEIGSILEFCTGTHAERRLHTELTKYFLRIVKMQKQDSNMVYVVSIGKGTPYKSKITWIDIVNKKKYYFHPSEGGGWPKEPPNFMGFRYNGKLQSIHHVEKWEIVEDLHEKIRELKSGVWTDFFLYKLGPAIKPKKDVITGNLYANGRVWAMLDLLLTSKSIAVARDLTKKRLGEG